MKIGKIKELYRYPVKSMGGERLREAAIMNHGFLGDRSFAFQTGSKYLTAQKLPHLLSFQASLISKNDQTSVKVTYKGREYNWEDAELIELLASMLGGAQLDMVTVNPDNEIGAVWEDDVLIISSSSIDEISKLCREKSLDIGRFRPNIVVELDSNIPFEEDKWIGKELLINNTRYRVNKNCLRCSYVNIDPAFPSFIDPNILRTIVKERDNKLGVYASVISPGEIYEGSDVILYKDT